MSEYRVVPVELGLVEAVEEPKQNMIAKTRSF